MTVTQAHVTHESIETSIITPGHPDRTNSPEYVATHKRLIFDLDTPCRWCGVKHSDLQIPHVPGVAGPTNPRGATFLESHHFPIEWSIADAVDWRKVQRDFPQVTSQEALMAFIDSPANMAILCDQCHTGKHGAHHVSYADGCVQPYLKDGYQYFADVDAAALAVDEQIDDALSAPTIAPLTLTP
jgi:hypothetical protein